MLFKMPQKTPQHFAYFCKWKNVAKIFQVSAHTVSVTWARWMESKQRFRARLRRRKWNYIYIRPLCHTIAAANCISCCCCCTLCVKRKPIHHRISIVVRVMRDVDLIRQKRQTRIVGKGILWVTSFVYKHKTSTTYHLNETTQCFVLLNKWCSWAQSMTFWEQIISFSVYGSALKL